MITDEMVEAFWSRCAQSILTAPLEEDKWHVRAGLEAALAVMPTPPDVSFTPADNRDYTIVSGPAWEKAGEEKQANAIAELRQAIERALAGPPDTSRGRPFRWVVTEGDAALQGILDGLRDFDRLSVENARLKAGIAWRDKVVSEAQAHLGSVETAFEEARAENARLAARLAEAEADKAAAVKAEREACAALCKAESEARIDRAKNPLPGDEYLGPWATRDVQRSKAVTAGDLAAAIRARGEGK